MTGVRRVNAMLAEHLGQVADDYHRDFKHNANMKQPDGSWQLCDAPRCERFRSMIAALVESMFDDADEYTEALRGLERRTKAAIHALEEGR